MDVFDGLDEVTLPQDEVNLVGLFDLYRCELHDRNDDILDLAGNL